MPLCYPVVGNLIEIFGLMLASSMGEIIPLPQIDVSVREATLADLSFVDHLQKLHSNQVGFMRTSGSK